MGGEPTDPRPNFVVAAPARAAVSAGSRLDHYEILELLGSGGMGEVYRARDLDLGRQVAIKVVRPDLAGRSSDTLLLEAQAMAKLSHPNVVVVYEVGTVGGEVYLAMEYVDGRTARAWLEAGPRRWREILSMFLAAGQGLAAAHRAGIVHRDFKPDNVLFGVDGRVRVADFGIAGEAADGSSAELPTDWDITETLRYSAVAHGTPAYMSPEQHLRRPVDARSDQFAFCVAVWEALYGARPFAGKSHTELRAAVAAGRIVEPPAGGRVPARIRAILTRGLSVNAAARYPTMDALLGDLARDPTAGWRRAGVAVALLAAAAGIFVVARRTGRPDDACGGSEALLAGVWDPAIKQNIRQTFLATERPSAQATFDRVEKGLDRYAAGFTAMRREACEATAVRHEQSEATLDLRMQCLDGRLEGLRALTALFARAPDATVLDRAVGAAGRLDDLAECGRTEALQAAPRLPADPETRDKVIVLRRRINELRVRRLAGKSRSALAEIEKTTAEIEALGYQPLVLQALVELAAAQGSNRRTADQEQTQRRVLQVAAALHDDPRVARVWTEILITVGDVENRPEEALALRTAAEAALVRAGDTDVGHAELDMALGQIYLAKNDFVAAERHLRQGIQRMAAAPDHDELKLAATLNALGGVYMYTGRWTEALAVFEQVKAMYERVLGPEHPNIPGLVLNIGSILLRQGHVAEAREHFLQAAHTWEQTFGPDFVDLGLALNNLGEVYLDEGRYEEGLAAYRRAVAIKEKAGAEERGVGPSLLGVARSLIYLDRPDEAVPFIDRAKALFAKNPGADSPDYAEALAAAAVLARKRGDCAAAVDAARHALPLYEQAYGDWSHPDLAATLLILGSCAVDQGRPAEAVVLLERVLFILVARGFGFPPDLPETELALARAFAALHEPEVATGLARRAREGFAALGPSQAARVAYTDRWLAGSR